MSRPQREDVTELPRTTTLSIRDYRRNLLNAVIIGLILGWFSLGIGFYTNWYYLLLLDLWNAGIHNWWLFPLIIASLSLLVYVNVPRRRRAKNAGSPKKEVN